jgi:multidrug efflux pump subunit AcrA (membrane-fusion protein)
LARLDDREQKAQLGRANAAVEQAQADPQGRLCRSPCCGYRQELVASRT